MAKEHLLLKWGALKGWKVESPEAYAALNDYADFGMPHSAMMQHPEAEQLEALCRLIDAIDGTITNGWTDEDMTKDEAKAYVRDYGKDVS